MRFGCVCVGGGGSSSTSGEATNGKEAKVMADVERGQWQRGGQGGEGGGQRGSQKWRRGNGWLSWGRGRRGGRRDCMGKD